MCFTETEDVSREGGKVGGGRWEVVERGEGRGERWLRRVVVFSV